MQDKGFTDKHWDWGEPIRLMGVTFSAKKGILRR